MKRARLCRGWLTGQGWPQPIVGDSGNGAHLLYGVDLPNDDEAVVLIKGVIVAVGAKWSDAAVAVDDTVFNASRISKVFGTWVRKGDNIPQRPHRQARILSAPERLEPVPADLLKRLVADHEAVPTAEAKAAGKAEPVNQNKADNKSSGPDAVAKSTQWVRQFLTAHDIQHTEETGSDRAPSSSGWQPVRLNAAGQWMRPCS